MKLYTVKVRSKNHSINPLRRYFKMRFRALIRFGSTTPTKEIYRISGDKKVVEINTVDAVENSRSKLKMKQCFKEAEVPQSKWWNPLSEEAFDENFFSEEQYPILAKRIFGFKGKGMFKLNNKEELEEFLDKNGSKLNNYYFEQFHNYIREYRLHCTKDGCFYAARKMLTQDVDKDKRWYRNDSNCVWVTEYTVIKDKNDVITSYDISKDNEAFDKPVNWNKIEEACVKALEKVGLDIGAFDVKVQGAIDSKNRKRENPEYIIIEVNSAPAFGVVTEILYKKELVKLLNDKYVKQNDV